MKTRFYLAALTTAIALMACVPTASAQKMAFKVEFQHAEMEVPPGGRTDMAVFVKGTAEGFTCAAKMKVTVPLILDPFAKWAGASLEPHSVTFEIPPQQPQPGTPYPLAQQSTLLNLAWNVEDAPRTGAIQSYIVKVDTAQIRESSEGGSNGPCIPSTGTKEAEPSGPMTAKLPDRPANATGTTVADCQQDPFQPICQTTVATAKGNSPGFDVVILLLGLLGVVMAFRRR